MGSAPQTITAQVPDAFFRAVAPFALPEPGGYAAGTAFLPVAEDERAAAVAAVERIAAEEHATVLGWREVPVDSRHVGAIAASTSHFTQLFLTPESLVDDPLALEGLAFCVRVHRERPPPSTSTSETLTREPVENPRYERKRGHARSETGTREAGAGTVGRND